MDYARELVGSTPECVTLPLDHARTAVDLTLIIDGSRTAYENLQLINKVSEMVDVSMFGSYISVVNGATGQFLVNRTNSVADLFQQLRNSSSIASKSFVENRIFVGFIFEYLKSFKGSFKAYLWTF